ncbi:MAG TPA: hypothetical protein PK170_03085 [Anaerolineae bacterium]|nr:hypothetical protein [Anaerolineae bacterium]
MQTPPSVHQVVLNVPAPLYQRVRRTADSMRRSVEDVLLDSVAMALPPLTGLPNEVSDDLASLAFLNDSALWNVARSLLPAEHHHRMDELLARKGQGRLTAQEQQVLDQLVNDYETLVLRRSQAALLLRHRGYDMSDPSILSRLP